MNITELARQLKITPKELKERLPELGFSIGERAIQIPDEQAIKVIEAFKRVRQQEKKQMELKEKVERITEIKSPLKQEERVVYLPPKIQVFELANRLNLPLRTVLSCLLKNGITASLNENLPFEIAAIIAEELGFKVKEAEEERKKEKIYFKKEIKEIIKNEPKDKLIPRPPVVVIMGHVDHGKTALLSAIYEIDFMQKESGGITQHIGAYQIKRKEKLITFIDTPGHVAFENMRLAGGHVADMAILVIAADDGIQPQTQEAIRIIQEEELPFIVAINKMDLPTADAKKVKNQLIELNLIPEEFGGNVICVEISAKKKKGIPELLDLILLVAETEEEKLLANPEGMVIGTIIESHQDAGFGPVATAIIFNGTLKTFDNIILSKTYGQAKILKDWQGKKVDSAGPSTPIQIFNFKALPKVGEILTVENNRDLLKEKIREIENQQEEEENIFQSIENNKRKSISFILRADTFGTLEAVVSAIVGLAKNNIKIQILKKEVGQVTESDIILAGATHSWIISFNVKIPSNILSLARERAVKISFYKIIYDLIEDIKKEIERQLSGEVIEKEIGELEIKACFSSSRTERIVGGKVISGHIRKGAIGRIFRGEEPLAEGEILELQVNKIEVGKVSAGDECGIKIKTNFEIKPGDILKIYSVVS